MYEKSFMHRGVVSYGKLQFETDEFWCFAAVCLTTRAFFTASVLASLLTDIVVTGSVDGYIKFWKKKQQEGLVFMKQYRAHPGALVITTFYRFVV